MITPIIMAGGSGTRLWPISRKCFPKQFTMLFDDQSLFQATVQRFKSKIFDRPMIMTNRELRFIVSEQLEFAGIEPTQIVVEPSGKNTAPPVLVAALMNELTPSQLLLVVPSDHIIGDTDAFHRAVENAMPAAGIGQIVTFGVQPKRPETGYGYIELPPNALEHSGQFIDVLSFVEKPNLQAAKLMQQTADYFWNTGIFLFRVDTIIEAFSALDPGMVKSCRAALAGAKRSGGYLNIDDEYWSQCSDISIDYAIMEKVDNLSVVPFKSSWSDLGSWKSVMQESDKSQDGNVLYGGATAIGCTDTQLRAEDDKIQLVGLGLEGVTAIATSDAVLVAKTDDSERVKEVIETLKLNNIKQAEEFNRSHRPWGYFEQLSRGDRYQVKRIVVKPKASLSLQSHSFRAEHWIVVEGAAVVTINDRQKRLTENQSVYVPLGAVHRLENTEDTPLCLIEVQSGSYLGEDDITRYKDKYSRVVHAA